MDDGDEFAPKGSTASTHLASHVRPRGLLSVIVCAWEEDGLVERARLQAADADFCAGGTDYYSPSDFALAKRHFVTLPELPFETLGPSSSFGQ